MTKLANNVTLDRSGGPGAFTINGEPFPWFISAENVEVSLGSSGHSLSTITVTIPFDGNFREWAK